MISIIRTTLILHYINSATYFFKIWFDFLSNLYPQPGAQTCNPKIKSHMFTNWATQATPATYFLTKRFLWNLLGKCYCVPPGGIPSDSAIKQEREDSACLFSKYFNIYHADHKFIVNVCMHFCLTYVHINTWVYVYVCFTLLDGNYTYITFNISN